MFIERATKLPDGRLLNLATGPENGPPLWLFHGLGRRWQDFGPLLADLSGQWHVSALDHRGHGRSSRADSYLVTDYVADAVAVVSSPDERAVLVGHSLGALTALGVAARSPQVVRAVVLLDPPGPWFLAGIASTFYQQTWSAMRRLAGGPVPEVARELAEVQLTTVTGTVRFGDVRDAASLRFMARCLRDLDPNAMTPALDGRWLDGFDLLHTARRVTCPALLVAGDPAKGGMLPPADADPLAAALADCTRVDLPGVGHLVHWQDAAATLRLLHGFLGSLQHP